MQNEGLVSLYCWENFFICTVADWTRCETPERPPDYISYSGSVYWKCKKKVKRLSDHWGQVSTCKWLLEGRSCHYFVCAECDYDEFRHISNLWREE